MGTFAIGWWGVNYYAALMDAFPKKCVSSMTGLAGTVGALSSVPGMWLTGYAADHGMYRMVFCGRLRLYLPFVVQSGSCCAVPWTLGAWNSEAVHHAVGVGRDFAQLFPFT